MTGREVIFRGNPAGRIGFLSVLGAVATLLLGGGPAGAEPDWIHKRQHDFPAKVISMTFANGDVMDQNKSVCWGKWCVKLDPNTSVAYYQCFSEHGICPYITIKGIVCENSGIGRVKNCDLLVNYKARGNYKTCDLTAAPYLNPSLRIECPVKIRFQ